MTDKREVAIQEWRRWLEEFRWTWFCTLKITSGIPSTRRAKQMCENWISELRRDEGGKDFRWFWVLERGADGSNLHFHLLVGGLRNRMKLWETRWKDLGGNAVITKFDPDQKGILYILKDMDTEGNIDCDFQLGEPDSKTKLRTEDLPRRSSANPTALRVAGIDAETTVAELKNMFKRYGRVLEIEILGTRTDDRLLMSAVITMASLYSALDAARQLDGEELRERPLQVSILEA